MLNENRILLQVNIVSNVLSTGIIAEDIAKVATSRGWKCYTAYGRISKPGVCSEIKVGGILDSCEHYLESRLFDNEGLASRRATRRLIKEIETINPDVIHLHNIHDHYLNYQILFNFFKGTNIQVVWTFHDFWAITGHCHHFIDAHCYRWKSLCYDCPLQHSTVNSVIDRSQQNYLLKKQLFTACNNLTIVPVSTWVGEAVRQSFLKDKRIEIIPNGINIEEFGREDLKECNLFPKEKFIILALARQWSYGDRKGLNEYLKLSKKLKDDELIVLVGMPQELSRQMPGNIVGLPRISDKKELVSLYSRADVLLSLSAAETFGLTILEANICGTPAVVYDNTAPPSLITPNTGFVAKNKDIDDVYSKIQIIKAKGSATYGKECIEFVKNNYDMNKNYQRYIDLYDELIRK